GRVRGRPPQDRDARGRRRRVDGRGRGRADRDQPGRVPAARVRVGRDRLRRRDPRRRREPARGGGGRDSDRPRHERRRRRLDAPGLAARHVPRADLGAALPAERPLRAPRLGLSGVRKHSPLLAIVAVAVGLAFMPNLQNATDFPVFYLVFGYFVFFWIAQATSWNILSGYTGYFSFGQAAFYGIGIYTVADLSTRNHMNLFLTITIAGAL